MKYLWVYVCLCIGLHFHGKSHDGILHGSIFDWIIWKIQTYTHKSLPLNVIFLKIHILPYRFLFPVFSFFFFLLLLFFIQSNWGSEASSNTFYLIYWINEQLEQCIELLHFIYPIQRISGLIFFSNKFI